MRKHLLEWLLVLSLLTVGVRTAFAVAAQEQTLLDKATSVTDTDGWDAHCHHDFDWYWLSDHEVLFARNDQGADPTIYYKRNVLTGKETKLSALTRALNGLRHEDRIVLSPDKKWAFTYDFRKEHAFIVALDGSRHFAVPYSRRFMTWLADSRHFLMRKEAEKSQRNHTVYLYDIQHPAFVRTKTLYSSLPVLDIYGLRRVGNHFLADGTEEEQNRIVLYQCGFGRRMSAARNIIVPLPRGIALQKSIKLRYSLLSPRADRIAYVLDVKRTSPYTKRSKSPQTIPPQIREFMEVWVSDLHGRHLHKIGALEKGPNDNEAGHYPLYLEWLPGGKALCADYGWKLYTIPVQ